MLSAPKIFIVTSLVLSLVFIGCKSKRKDDTSASRRGQSTDYSKLPKWVSKGSRTLKGDRGEKIVGVGAVSNIRLASLRMKTAGNQARVEIARILQTNIEALTKDYTRQVGNLKNAEVEQLIQDVNKVYTDATISGAEIVDRYYDKKTDTEYALAVMDVALFRKLTEEAKQLPDKVKEYILKNANDAFKELDSMKGK